MARTHRTSLAGLARLVPLAVAALVAAGCSMHETPTPPSSAAQQNVGPKQADASGPPHTGEVAPFQATAYSIEGKTASGKHAREGLCAADPTILPLGSRIRVHDAGSYSGECEIADTGRAIKGREIDIYLANDSEAKKFGKKEVRVEVLSSTK